MNNTFDNTNFDDIFNWLLGNNKAANNLSLAAELDKLYWTDKTHYIYRLEKIKETYKVMRNDKGVHKVLHKFI